jgi:hypothetical protein
MKTKFLAVLLGALALAACSTHSSIDKLSQADPFQKTISIPPTTPANANDNLMLHVQAELTNANWQFQTANGQPVQHPRYSMSFTYEKADEVCMSAHMDSMYNYDIHITDNHTGGPAFVMHGKDCEHTILQHLDDWLRNKQT